jgi:hypothetical protein
VRPAWRDTPGRPHLDAVGKGAPSDDGASLDEPDQHQITRFGSVSRTCGSSPTRAWHRNPAALPLPDEEDSEEVARVGPIEVTAEREKTFALPPVASGVSLVAGLALVGVGLRRK